MEQPLKYEVHPKETIYFVIKLLAAIGGYMLIALYFLALFHSPQPQVGIIMMFYISIIVLYLFFQMGILTGYLKGNAVKVTAKQFPEIHAIVMRHCRQLELTNIPDVYIM